MQGVIDIVTEYGFDGIDIDYEGGSMTVLNSPSNSLEYSAITDPELKYGIDAIREIKAHFGDNFLITTAPELYYVQEGRSSYPSGSQFIAFLHNIRDILDLIHVQYYNFGTALWSALDGNKYDLGDVDLVVAMTDMLIQGFPLTNGVSFPGLRQDQVAIGLPCVPNAAGGVSEENPHGYYFTTDEVTHALNYLMKGERDKSLNYMLRDKHYPNLRGIMTWSINWDATTDGNTAVYEFANTYSTYFDSLSQITPLGTPHSWLDQYGLVSDGNYADSEMQDSDGDGFNNHQEFIMGTVPVDADSLFRLNLLSDTNGYLIHWTVTEDREYHLEWTNSLSNAFQTIETFTFP
ncbi:MAG: glycosyl hydrolase family 18 protein, partial [Opitutae bacterium]|nr:glycosyl hydrolase family 18 protein [Opitutae bacterium]